MNIRPHVLHVDDSEDDRSAFARAVELCGMPWALTGVGSAAEALLLLNRIGPFDRLTLPRLVVVALELPVMDGWELLRIFARSAFFRELPVVVLADRLAAGEEQACLGLGAKAVFLKPGSGAPGSDAILAMGRLILDHALPPGPPP